MSADFVPFLQTISARVAPPQNGPAAFTPAVPPSTSAAQAPHHHAAAEVRVELKRDGDRISLIRVHCRCGETIELTCDYT